MGDSLCLPLLCAFSLTMHCSDFLAPLPSLCLNHPPSHRSLNKMHEHTPTLDSPEKKKKSSRGFSFTPKPVLSLHLFLCHLSVLIHPPPPPPSHLCAYILLSVHARSRSLFLCLLLFLHFILSFLETKERGMNLSSTFLSPM